jgi:sulfide:quinone oxidoreductase
LHLIQLTDTLFVSGQPAPSDIAELAEQGFTSLICNRPDGESPGQASMDEIEALVQQHGMSFVRYPVNPVSFPGEDLEGLGLAFDAPGKVLAYCRTGTRCTNLWVASRSADEIKAAAEQAQALGFDLSLVARLSL